MKRHPLPWNIECDWTVEVHDANNNIVIKLMTVAEARELIDFAVGLAKRDTEAAAEVAKLLSDFDIEP